jgi:hypothetical protein
LWFFPLFLVLASLLFGYFFLSSPKSSGLAAIVGLFYQCVGLLFAQSAASDVFGVRELLACGISSVVCSVSCFLSQDTITSLFDFRLNTGGSTGILCFPPLIHAQGLSCCEYRSQAFARSLGSPASRSSSSGCSLL